MQIKKILMLMLSTTIIACGTCGILTSCNGKTFNVDWRNEDLEWSVGNPLMKDREWVWNTSPNVANCKFGVDKNTPLPSGIILTPDGQLIGTPAAPFVGNVKFTCAANGYKTNVSKPIKFIINQAGTNPAVVDWFGDVWFQNKIALGTAPNTDTKIYNGTLATTGGKFRLRGGWYLPAGLSLDATTGALSGTSNIVCDKEISFEYYSESGTFETNISPIFHIYTYYKHSLTIGFNQLDSQGNSWLASNNLTTTIKSISNNHYNSFNTFTKYLVDNAFWLPKTLPAQGAMKDNHRNISYNIAGIELIAPHSSDTIVLTFSGDGPGWRVELKEKDFISFVDTIV